MNKRLTTDQRDWLIEKLKSVPDKYIHRLPEWIDMLIKAKEVINQCTEDEMHDKFKSAYLTVNTETNELLVNVNGKYHQLGIMTLIHRTDNCGSQREVIKVGHEVENAEIK